MGAAVERLKDNLVELAKKTKKPDEKATMQRTGTVIPPQGPPSGGARKVRSYLRNKGGKVEQVGEYARSGVPGRGGPTPPTAPRRDAPIGSHVSNRSGEIVENKGRQDHVTRDVESHDGKGGWSKSGSRSLKKSSGKGAVEVRHDGKKWQVRSSSKGGSWSEHGTHGDIGEAIKAADGLLKKQSLTRLSSALESGARFEDEVVSLATIRIPVMAHERLKDGKVQHVDAYVRTVKVGEMVSVRNRDGGLVRGEVTGVREPSGGFGRRLVIENRQGGRGNAVAPRVQKIGFDEISSIEGPGVVTGGASKSASDASVRDHLRVKHGTSLDPTGIDRTTGEQLRSMHGGKAFTDKLVKPSKGSGGLPLTSSGHRSLGDIATDIRKDWKQPNYAAAPYLDAMSSLSDITDAYGADSASIIVNYFLANAGRWSGPEAKRIKAELRAVLKKKR